MARKPNADFAAWPALTLEGNLIAPAMIAIVANQRPSEKEEATYGLRKGLSLRDELTLAFRVGQAHFDDFAKLEAPSLPATTRFVSGLLSEAFGFTDLAQDALPITLAAGAGRVPIVIVPPTDPIDRRSAVLSIDRSRSAAFALQDHLNARDDALWGLATNGTVLRLMRDNASLTRPAYIEANLAQMFQTEDLASFATLWLLIHRTRFGQPGAPATDCALERWRETGAKEGEVARDRLAKQVEEALKILGSGFLEANPELRARLSSGQLPLTEWFNELLRLIYRLIFLMVAEDRNLLHSETANQDARRLYHEGYSMAHLRDQALRRAAWDRHHDRFEGMKVTFRALAKGEVLLALPALGGLFTATQLPHLDNAKLPNNAFLNALYRLAYLKSEKAILPVNWRAMETEELGSVYESLLELQPQLTEDGKALTFATESAEQKGNQRKTTGSYYTPDSLVQALLDTALNPVIDQCEGADDPAKALLNLTVIDPACGSGHFLLAAARRIATRLARHRAHGTPAASDFRHALRDVARHCLHGVDRNPMAVELTKVALWIETVDPGKPLGFFDAQIRCGDALLGVFDLKALDAGIPDAAYKPLSGDDKPTAKYYAKANKDAKTGQATFDFDKGRTGLPEQRQLAADYTGFRALTEDTLDQIEAKRAGFDRYRNSQRYHCDEMACDMYIAAFLLPKVGGAPSSRGARQVPTSEDVWIAKKNGQVWGPLIHKADVARTARAFHWPLEFPDVMARGGFDVLLGNPPWERIKLQEQEFFAARSPEIAGAPNKAAREKLIKALAEALEGSPHRALYDDFQIAKRVAEAASEFARVPEEEEFTDKDRKDKTRFVGGRFPLTGRGDVNTYALFAELFSRLAGPKGRAGVIVPTGIATDATTAPFFASLVEGKRLHSLYSFKEIRAIFLATDDRNPFCIITLGRDQNTARFAFSLNEPSQLSNPERTFTLTRGAIARLNPNTRTAPVFRSRADAELTAKIYENAPVLIDESKGAEGNPWGANFMSMFHMSNDSPLFRTAKQLAASGFNRLSTDWHDASNAIYVPLYEAKMIHQFDHRWMGYKGDGETSADFGSTEKLDPYFEPEPRYWVPRLEVEARLNAKGWTRNWMMGWRDIARGSDDRTTIVSNIARMGCAGEYALLFFTAGPILGAGIYANLNALTLDFVARQKTSGAHLKQFALKQFPILPPSFYTEPRQAFITPKVLELTYTSHALAPFARDLGYDGTPFAWDEARRAQLRADLDAFYARAYGLTRDELRYILDPADIKGPDYPSETFRVLKEKELRLYNEYRTRRLVLEAWDRMEALGEFTAMEM